MGNEYTYEAFKNDIKSLVKKSPNKWTDNDPNWDALDRVRQSEYFSPDYKEHDAKDKNFLLRLKKVQGYDIQRPNTQTTNAQGDVVQDEDFQDAIPLVYGANSDVPQTKEDMNLYEQVKAFAIQHNIPFTDAFLKLSPTWPQVQEWNSKYGKNKTTEANSNGNQSVTMGQALQGKNNKNLSLMIENMNLQNKEIYNPEDLGLINAKSNLLPNGNYETLVNANVGDIYQVGNKDSDAYGKMIILTEKTKANSQAALDKMQQGGNGDTSTAVTGQNSNEETASDEGDNSGIQEMYEKFREIESKKAGLHDLPVEFKDFKDNLQYESLYTDWLRYQDAKNLENEAHDRDPVRAEAKTYRAQLEEISKKGNSIIAEKEKLEKALKKANSMNEARTIKAAIKTYDNELNKLYKQWEDATNIPMSKIDDNDYLVSIGVDPEGLESLAQDAGIDLEGFLGNISENKKKLDYLKNNIKDDMNVLMDEKASDEDKQAAAERVDQVLPDLRKHIENDLNLAKKTLPAMRKIAENINDPDIMEMLENVEGMTHLFEEQNKMLLNDENIGKVMDTMKKLDDIVKHQDNYDADSRYARDARLSAYNKFMFDLFDRMKSDFVFIAAMESGRPEVVRSALDDFNYRLEMAENKRQTDKFGAYTENRLRDITGNNIAEFKKITEVEPALAQLEGQIDLESRKGRAQMKSLIDAWKAYQEQMSTLQEADKVSFANWIRQNMNAGNGSVAAQIINALLTNVPQVASLLDGALASGIESHAEGGIVGNTDGATIGPDNTTINAREGEMVLNAEQQKKLWDLLSDKDSGTKEKKTGKWLDSAASKLSKKSESEKEPDPDLTIDMQDTINNALAARTMPPQAGAPQAGAPKTSNGFGRTNMA